ncbi:type II toxin-antitoxin system PemK/MazF family toxin [Saliphagus infecundisoli]|uniref:Type II toxin-antitoxin system PemK/MazF family toxin n=1 Tax=Saliphagus infecundisoli TaxID=1849069 RepID=A0ABD5QHV4_9EURY|nr:type II toxin-antitoxin system PemK/MazF family toxin [Saliphagus infecundisoli]
MAYAHGSVVIVDDPYKRGRRPFLVVSNDTRPYFGEDYTLAVMTTTEFSEAVQLNANDITEGRLNTFPSFIKPWSVHEFDHDEIDRRVAHVSNEVLDDVADAAYGFIEPKD